MNDHSEAPLLESHDMGFFEHIGELRKRVLYSIIALIAGFAVTYPFAEQLFDLLRRPLDSALGSSEGAQLIFTGPLEVFVTFLKLGVLSGLCVSFPVVCYQAWSFIAPGLRKKERHLILPVVILSSLFFLGGVVFAYTLVLPAGYQFFINYGPDNIFANIRVQEYFSLTIKLLLALGLAFELPLVLLVLIRLGIVSVKTVLKQWRWIIIGNLIISAILTPADPLTMIMMAAPLSVLFFLSLAVGTFFERKR